METAKRQFQFCRIGGTLQLRLDSADSLRQVLELDEAFWAMTSVEIDSLRFDRKFLECLDSDGNGKIRADEVKNALTFLCSALKNLDGVVSGSDELRLEDIDTGTEAGRALFASAKLILEHLHAPERRTITLEEIRADRGGLFFTGNNGDGVVTEGEDFPAEINELISLIRESGRTTKELSDQMGVSIADIEDFIAAAQTRIAYAAEPERDSSLLPAGAETAGRWQLLNTVRGAIDGYFLSTEARRFLAAQPERTAKYECSADLLVPETMRKALADSVAVMPTGEDELDFSAALNPLYAASLRRFAALPEVRKLLHDGKLSFAGWEQIKQLYAPYGEWLEREPVADRLGGVPVEKLKNILDSGTAERLLAIAKEDLSCAGAAAGSAALLKLALFQRDMMEFLNNFTSLTSLFDPHRFSRLQAGKLVIDGRCFTLAAPVYNIAEHKRIVLSSDICVIYVEVSGSYQGKPVKKQLAVGVTNGSMRNLFIGKRGIFFDAGGGVLDARIFDMIEQPVSVAEALKSPFFRFADFLGKQAEKIFATRSNEMQKAMSIELNASASALPKIPTLPAKNAAPAAAAPGLPMLLMGGGIGIAALGSSVAFIAKSLQNISLLNVLGVIAGIVVVFGGPMVVISLIKLYRRNLSRFLESSGCAINRPMRLSHRMGRFFTYAPKRPSGGTDRFDLLDLLPGNEKKKHPVRLAVLLAILILVIAGAVFFFRSRCSCTGKAENEISVRSAAPCGVSEKTEPKLKK